MHQSPRDAHDLHPLQKIGVPGEAMVKATGRFLDLAIKAPARRGIPTSWIYVHENDVSDGWHCHILMHVPKDAVDYIIHNQIRWIKSISGRSYEPKVINSRIIGGRLGIERTCPEVYLINLAGTLDYVVKQTSDDTVARFQLTRQSCPGLIVGKRTGTSQNIAVTARRRHHTDASLRTIYDRRGDVNVTPGVHVRVVAATYVRAINGGSRRYTTNVAECVNVIRVNVLIHRTIHHHHRPLNAVRC